MLSPILPPTGPNPLTVSPLLDIMYLLGRKKGFEFPIRHIDYVKGANIAAFIKVAEAMLAYGVV